MLEEGRRLRREPPLAWLWRATLFTEYQRAEWRRAAMLVELTRI
jgi:hypothetical protein